MTLCIKCDNREPSKLTKEFKQHITNTYGKYNIFIDFRIEMLRVADFEIGFLYNDENGDEYMETHVIVERKRWSDFVGSINSSRYKEQKHNMIRLSKITGCVPMYIFEGRRLTKTGFYGKTKTPNARLIGKTRRLSINKIPCLYTKDQNETCEMLVDLTRDVYNMKNRGKLQFCRNTDNVVINELEKLSSYPCLSDNLKREIISVITNNPIHLTDNLCAIETNIKLTFDSEDYKLRLDVIKIWKVLCSNKMANSLIKLITLWEFIQNPDILYDVNISYDSGRTVGDNMKLKIISKLKNKDVQLKLLSKIPSVSTTKAQIILDNILDLKFINEEICEYKLNNRRLGNAMYTKIQTHLNFKMNAET